MSQKTILIVDDSPENLTVLGEMLHSQYTVRAAISGERALQLAAQLPVPDLILLDVMMPRMNGHEVLRRLGASPLTRDIPVIFITAMVAAEDEQHGLVLGAVDYITKPLRPAVLLARVHTHLELKAARDCLRSDNIWLEAEVARRQRENSLIQDVAIRAMARLAETRDNETGNHLLRTQEYVRRLATSVRHHPRFAGELDDHAIALMACSAPLHDIGKVGIPDRILLKPGRLDAEEWETMKTHARLGAEAIERAVADTEQPMPFLRVAQHMAHYHHERWNGQGYPEGLAGDAIPLCARLMAIADVFDALISRRVYKEALDFAQVRELMAAERGRHFDPDLLDAFLAQYEVYCDIARRRPDEPPQEIPTARAVAAVHP
jgi:putative two-component system response regulator